MLCVIAKVINRESNSVVSYKVLSSLVGRVHNISVNKAFETLKKGNQIQGLLFSDNKIIELGEYTTVDTEGELIGSPSKVKQTIISKCGNTIKVSSETGMCSYFDIKEDTNRTFTNGAIVNGKLEIDSDLEDISLTELGVVKSYRLKTMTDKNKSLDTKITSQWSDVKSATAIKSDILKLSKNKLDPSFSVVSRDEYVNVATSNDKDITVSDVLYVPGLNDVIRIALVEIMRYNVVHYLMIDVYDEAIINFRLISEFKDMLYISDDWKSYREDGVIQTIRDTKGNSLNDGLIIGIGDLGVVIIQKRVLSEEYTLDTRFECIPFDFFCNVDEFKILVRNHKCNISIEDGIIDKIYDKIEEYREVCGFQVFDGFEPRNINHSDINHGMTPSVKSIGHLGIESISKLRTNETQYISVKNSLAIKYKNTDNLYLDIKAQHSRLRYLTNAEIIGLDISESSVQVIPLNTLGYIALNKLNKSLYNKPKIISDDMIRLSDSYIYHSEISGDTLSVYTDEYRIDYSISSLLGHAEKMKRYALKMQLLTGKVIEITDEGAIMGWSNGTKLDISDRDEIYYIIFKPNNSGKDDTDGLVINKTGHDMVLIDSGMYSFYDISYAKNMLAYNVAGYKFLSEANISIKNIPSEDN